MFPIGDDDVRGAPPPLITWGLVALNLLVWIYELSMSRPELQSFVQNFGVVPAQILQGQQLHTLLTSMFMHGGWMHIISNMAFLLVFGDNVEAVLGKLGYLVFYLLGGLAASAAFIATNPGGTSPSLGASGALAAVMGGYVVMFPRAQIRALVFLGFFVTITRITAFAFLGIWFVLQLFQGVGSLGIETSGGVAYWAHIGGFVFGVVAGFLLRGKAQKAKRQGV